MIYKTKRQRNEQVRAELDQEFQSFLPRYRELNDYILPTRGRFLVSDVNRGDRRNQKIIDPTGTHSARTLQAGMMAGVTSPARPWFRLTTPDPGLAEYSRVKTWLHIVGQRMTNVFLRSNLYKVLPTQYGDLGTFGTAPISIEEDFMDTIRAKSYPVGSYRIAQDSRGMVNVFFRQFRMSVRQIVEKFGKIDEKTGKADWSTISQHVKDHWDRSNYETWVDVNHLTQPNPEFDPRRMESSFKRFSTSYYEAGVSSRANTNYLSDPGNDVFLSEKGFDLFPILCPRWEVSGEDVYGTNCPGMLALPDIKQLQHGEKRGAQAIDKMVNPPLIGPSFLKSVKTSLLPGDVTYADMREGMQGLRPIHETTPRIQELEGKQQNIRGRIEKAYFADLFLMLANDSRSGVTAREIDERHEEKMLALGPVLQQIDQDNLNPLIELTYHHMERQGQIPPPPQELEGVALKVEYISVMAQAQKLIGLGGMERFFRFVATLQPIYPAVMDKVDVDQGVDEYGDGVGVSPLVVRSDEDTAAIRQQQAKAQQAQMQAQMIEQGAGAAKNLSQADMSGDNALTRLVGS